MEPSATPNMRNTAYPSEELTMPVIMSDSAMTNATETAAPTMRGQVAAVRGSRANVALPVVSPGCPEHARATVGKFMGIEAGNRTLIGVITDVRLQGNPQEAHDAHSVAEVDLIGEIRSAADGSVSFRRGVTGYPAIGDRAALVTSDVLRLIFNVSSRCSVEIGQLQQDPALGAFI